MMSAEKAGQRPLIVSGGDRILSDIEKLWIFTIVKMRFGMFEVKYQPKVDQCSLGAHSVPAGCEEREKRRRKMRDMSPYTVQCPLLHRAVVFGSFSPNLTALSGFLCQ
jgi:hypothetical protein